MTSSKYKKEVEKWKKWEREMSLYYSELKKLHDKYFHSDPDRFGREKDQLDTRMNFLGLYTGPTTQIFDFSDLVNPDFILPGDKNTSTANKSMCLEVAAVFGKRVASKHSDVEGIVIGYAYDALDGYVIIADKEGGHRLLLVNGGFKVVE